MQLLKARGVVRQAPEKEHVDKLLTAWQGNDCRLKFRLFILPSDAHQSYTFLSLLT